MHEEYSQGGSQTPWSVGLKGQVEDQMGPRHQAWAAGARDAAPLRKGVRGQPTRQRPRDNLFPFHVWSLNRCTRDVPSVNI